ncbi:MAG: bifunctional demethylmenaquinone methyltransferase/2-methoxy-6-polyprenyl-1,4-benzoquinol methylase UbiE [Chlamydiae bacterium]|nr:bifunctional demethylmenaquinone methyltransferase/2-methoxy-6-polyprenyl-1,4-benzoquinol methylase UbiE [Chlamydiota bacterium]
MQKTVQEPSKVDIWKMFDAISNTYDRTNHWMTAGLDLYWRGKLARFLPKHKNIDLLDCATGTGDQIFSLIKRKKMQFQRVVGVDLSENMLALARKKAQKQALSIEFIHASALSLPFDESSFDCVTISFGLRNVTDTQACLKEMFRVLRPEGRLLILETSLPKSRLVRSMHLLYLRHLLPRLGGMISKHRKAYSYLNQTTETFPHGQALCDALSCAEFTEVAYHPLSLGVVALYVANKPNKACVC